MTMMGGNLGAPGTRTTRQENSATEFTLPLLQAAGRVLVDILAVVCITLTLIMVGRWAIWMLIALLLFSTGKEQADKWLQAHLVGFGARVLEVISFALPWLWLLGGWIPLMFIWPFTWGISGGWHGLVIETLRPLAQGGWEWYGIAMITLHPFWRLLLLALSVTPLYTWGAIRDRFKWELWLVVPTTAVPVQEAGLDPHKWGLQAAPPATSALRPVEVWYTHDDRLPNEADDYLSDEADDITPEEFEQRAQELNKL